MINKLLAISGLLAVLVGPAAAQIMIYADANDGFLEDRQEWTTGPTVHGDTFGGWNMNIGEWYGTGLTTAVIPFELPALGAIANPFVSADFAVNLYEIGGSTVTPIDLYAVRVDVSPLITTNDWYIGTEADPTATMIQTNFFVPTNALGQVHTDEAGDTALVDYLNAAYDSGAGAGQFVFIRLSYHSDNFASGWDAYKITSREAQYESDWPVIAVTTASTDTDGDSMPDVWELSNGLDPYDDGTTNINNGAYGDPDIDSLVNSNEYILGLDPQNPDCDDDGLKDGEEVDSHGTDPLDRDSDDDQLTDGDEVNTYGTLPLDQHSDTDGEPDGIEVSQGTDPLDPLSSSAALGLVIIDGTLDASFYGDAAATQTVNTAWGDNANELNAAYTYVQNGKLFLMLTGNIQNNWNKIEIFIDSTDAVTTNVLDAAGNDGTDFMDGLTFDIGFSPDYHLSARRGFGQYFNLDMAELGTGNVSSHQNLFNDSMEGFAHTGAGDANASPIGVAYDNSNTNGLVGGEDAANLTNVLAVTTGLELSIALSDLGNPETVRIMVFINGAAHDWISNQVLPGFAPPQGALGRDGLGGDAGGTITDTLSAIDFNNFIGNQFFDVEIPLIILPPHIMTGQLISGNTEMQLSVGQLALNADYKIQDAADLTVGFADVPGSDFTATGTNMVIIMPADTDANPVMFYRVVSP